MRPLSRTAIHRVKAAQRPARSHEQSGRPRTAHNKQRAATSASTLRRLLLLDLGDLRSQLGLVLRFRLERQRDAIEIECAFVISALRKDIAEMLVNGGIARQQSRG